MPSIAKARVIFSEARQVTIDDQTKWTLTAPNRKTVQQLGLKNAPGARVGFDIEGTVIYAKTGAEPQKIKILWEKAIGRWQNRHRSSIVAFRRISKNINALPAASRSPEVQDQLVKVWMQIKKSASVRADDLDALFSKVADVEKSHAAAEKEKARVVERKHQINVAVKGAARLITADAAPIIEALPPCFTDAAASDFRTFIKQAADPNNQNPPNYELAREFAEQWVGAGPNGVLGEPIARNLIDSFVKLVMEGCEIKSPPAADRFVNKFTAKNEALLDDNGKLFLPVNRIGQGAFGSVSIYRSATDAETVVVKNLKRANAEDMKTAAKELEKEAKVHAQAAAGNSNHIVGFLGMVEGPEGHPMLILEHAPNGDGATLQENIDKALENNELTGEAASHILMTAFSDMVKGVADAHELGIMHLDVKPPNYIADKLGRFKLADFGTSRRALAECMESPVEAPGHSAPELSEQRKENLITYKADVWSLGVILYESINDQLNNHSGSPLQQPFSSRFTYEGHDKIRAFIDPSVDRYTHLHLDRWNETHRLIIQMLDPDPSMRPSLKTVLEHPSIAPYASPRPGTEATIVQRARQWIIESQGTS